MWACCPGDMLEMSTVCKHTNSSVFGWIQEREYHQENNSDEGQWHKLCQW